MRTFAPLEFLKAGPILTPYDWTFDSCGSGAEIDHFGPGSVSQNGKRTAKVPCVQWREEWDAVYSISSVATIRYV